MVNKTDEVSASRKLMLEGERQQTNKYSLTMSAMMKTKVVQKERSTRERCCSTEQRPEYREELSLVHILGKRIPGIGNYACKSPEVGTRWHCSGKSKDASGRGESGQGRPDLAGPRGRCIVFSLTDQECPLPLGLSER